MKHDHTNIMKAIWGIVLMVNLALVPFYNAAIAAGNNAPSPSSPGTTPEWSFETNEETAAVLGITGTAAEVSLQPEFEDPALQELFDFHVLAFETVFGRDYDGTESAYFFEQPLDESTYATVVPGWNTVGEPVDAMVLFTMPIDVSDLEPNEHGATIVSAAYIAGTLEGEGTEGFWGVSRVHSYPNGEQYNNLILVSELDTTTEHVLTANIGLLDSLDMILHGYGLGDFILPSCASLHDFYIQHPPTWLSDTATTEPDFQHGPAGWWVIPIAIGGAGCGLKIAFCLDDVVDAWALCRRGCDKVYENDDTGRARCRICCDILRVDDAENCALSCGLNGPDGDYSQCYMPPFAPPPADDNAEEPLD